MKNKDDQFTIRCVSNCIPNCSYSWTRQVQNVQITLTNTDSLRINRILPSDAGRYKCTVRNSHGGITVTKSKTMVLIVKGKDYMVVTSAENSVSSVAGYSSLVVDCRTPILRFCHYENTPMQYTEIFFSFKN